MKLARALLLPTFALALAGCGDKAKAADAANLRGVAARNQGDYAQAITEYDEAIRLRPDVAGYYNNRGLIRQITSDYQKAIQDFDKALSLNPSHETALKSRGRAHFYMGDFADAAADLRKGLALDEAQAGGTPDGRFDSGGAYALISYHIAMRRLGQDDSRELTALMTHVDTTKWPAPILRFYTNRLSADQLIAAAAVSGEVDTPDQRCAAHYYIGEADLWAGRTTEAEKHFRETIATCPKRFSEYHGATAALATLRK